VAVAVVVSELGTDEETRRRLFASPWMKKQPQPFRMKKHARR
jgi:hypothetical protein